MKSGYRNTCLAMLCTLILVLSTGWPGQAQVLDSGFGSNGQVTTALGPVSDQAYGVAIQPDGKIVVAGSSSTTADLDFAVVRYDEHGRLDDGFNGDGLAITAVGAGDDEARAVTILEDGRIVVGGYSWNGTDREFALACYLPDGTLDTEFGLDGTIVTPVGNQDDEILALAALKNGGLVVAGYSTGTAGKILTLASYHGNGSPDTEFGENGIAYGLVGDGAEATALKVLPDGKLLVGGVYTEGGRSHVMVLRYHADGSLDESFGENGIAVPQDSETETQGYGLEVDANGAILVAGSMTVDGNRDVALFRFRSNGEVDGDFGYHGVVIAGIGPEDDVGYDVKALDNALVVVGYTTENGVRRFLRLEYGLSEDGNKVAEITAATVEFGPQNEESRSMAVQEDGKVVGVGYSEDTVGSRFALARYTAIFPTAPGSSTRSGDNTPGLESPDVITTPVSGITRNSVLSGGIIKESPQLDYGLRGVVVGIAPYPVYTTDSADGTSSTSQASPLCVAATTDSSTSSKTDDNANLWPVAEPGWTTCHTEDGSGPGQYGSVIEGLKIGTRYYLRAYVLDLDGGIHYGNQISFTTADACFIATAAFGSLLDPRVNVLRIFRDRYLLTNGPGRFFVRTYYRLSPPVAEVIANHGSLRGIVRLFLYPLVVLSSLFVWTGGIGMIGCGLLLVAAMAALGVISLRYILRRRHNRGHNGTSAGRS